MTYRYNAVRRAVLDRQMAAAEAQRAEQAANDRRLKREERLWYARFCSLLAAIAASPLLLGKLLGL